MNIKEFLESEDSLAIHCNTEEKANKLLKKFDELGPWVLRESCLDDTCYRIYDL